MPTVTVRLRGRVRDRGKGKGKGKSKGEGEGEGEGKSKSTNRGRAGLAQLQRTALGPSEPSLQSVMARVRVSLSWSEDVNDLQVE